MRVGFVADVHAGNFRRMGGQMVSGLNRRGSQTVATLELAMTTACSMDCDLVAVLGDLHDDMNPSPQLITAVQKALDFRVRRRLMLGNHDMFSEQPGDHALGPYSLLDDGAEDGIEVIEQPYVEVYGGEPLGLDPPPLEICYIPFAPGDAREWLPAKLAQVQGAGGGRRPASSRLLALHLGIIDEDTAPWLRICKDAVPLDLLLALCDQYKFDAVFAGNWHERRIWLGDRPAPVQPGQSYPIAGRGPLIAQVGTLCPTGFDNPGLLDYGSLLIWESSGSVLDVVEIPGPRFLSSLRITNGDAWRVQSGTASKCQVYMQVKALPEEQADILLRLEQMRTQGLIVDGEVAPDDSMVKVAAEAAAEAASGADTLDQAIAKYIAEMPLPDGFDRGALLARVRKYVGG